MQLQAKVPNSFSSKICQDYKVNIEWGTVARGTVGYYGLSFGLSFFFYGLQDKDFLEYVYSKTQWHFC